MYIKKIVGLLLFSVMFLLVIAEAQAQQTLRYKAERQKGRRVNKERIDFLIGNVQIRQGTTTILADSAQVQKKENRAEAFGRIRVEEGDSVTITGKRLIYEGSNGTAYIYNDVVYQDGNNTLYTDHLEFNKFTGISSYFGGGRMIDEQNTLTSRQGAFDKPNSTASFFGDVVLKTPDATVTSDTLYYNTQTGQARFVGFTRVVKNDGTITEAAEGLTYNTQSENAAVLQGFIENQDYIITGDKLLYNKQKQLFTAEGRVKMTAKDKKIIIIGDEAYYDRATGVTQVFGRPLMKRPVENDTLYMVADTMMALESELQEKKRLLAWGGVKLFKQDLQGVSDSLAYRLADSVLYFYQNPVLWNEQNQMTGDTITMQIQNNKIDRMRLLQNGFVISRDSILDRYNQVKGRLITAFFGEDELKEVAVNGNAESIYFVLDEKTINTLLGMNRITSSSMLIKFGNRTVQQIRFYQQPEATFVPPHELQEPETKLQGFQWQAERRPLREEVVNRLKAKDPASETEKSGAPAATTGLPVKELDKGEAQPQREEMLPVQQSGQEGAIQPRNNKQAVPSTNRPKKDKPLKKAGDGSLPL